MSLAKLCEGTEPTWIQVVVDLGFPLIFPLIINFTPKMALIFSSVMSLDARRRFLKSNFKNTRKRPCLDLGKILKIWPSNCKYVLVETSECKNKEFIFKKSMKRLKRLLKSTPTKRLKFQ